MRSFATKLVPPKQRAKPAIVMKQEMPEEKLEQNDEQDSNNFTTRLLTMDSMGAQTTG